MMIRTAAVLSVALTLSLLPVSAEARPTPKPAATVAVSAAFETCWAGGYVEVGATIKATKAGTYDIWLRGDNDFTTWVVETDTFTAGQTYTLDTFELPWPQKVDVVVTRTGDPISRPLAARSAPAASTCGGE